MKVITTKRKFGKDHRQGIHLLNPTDAELDDARQIAARDGYPVIYVHMELGMLNYAVRELEPPKEEPFSLDDCPF